MGTMLAAALAAPSQDGLAACARQPQVQAALVAACQHAAAVGARAALCLIEFGTAPRPSDAEPSRVRARPVARGLRGRDVIASCAQGIVVVAGPFSHPADAELCASRLSASANHETPTIGLAIYPNHGATPERLIEHAAASLSRLRGQLPPPNHFIHSIHVSRREP